MTTDTDYLAVLKASYDYQPQSDDEIAIEENQLLLLLARVDDDWWKVKVKADTQESESPVGLVPAAYVEQADHNSIVKVIYDYEAAAPGELSVKEDQVLLVFDTDEDWLLVQTQDSEKAGYVPGNYVEATTEDHPSAPAPSRIVVPDSPPQPVSTYVDPADRVASSKVTADDIKTWSVSEMDKKGKKKKGTLGVGNGAVFFASESDKTPVQKWQTTSVDQVSIEKPKHIRLDIGGFNPITLHFHTGSKDNAEEIVAKLESSKALSSASGEQSKAPASIASSPKKASVHFSNASPVIIPPPEGEEEEEEEVDQIIEPEHPPANGHAKALLTTEGNHGEVATALYDFSADGEDELSVTEGESLIILEKDGDEWWKCRNANGAEGVVPASYLEATAGSSSASTNVAAPIAAAVHEEEPEDDSETQAAREAAEREEAERARKAQAEERERAEKARKKLEAQQRAKDAAAAAEAERKKRKEASVAAASRVSPPPVVSSPSKPSDSGATSPSSARPSENSRPPPEKVRIWHDRSGQFRVEAAFLGFTNGKVRLHKTNGVTVEVPSEKMSSEDMRYVEKFMIRKSRTAPTKRVSSDDDIPLAVTHPSSALASRPKSAPPAKQVPKIDWFDFFLSAGCDVDDCTRYAASFERDKIDESILPDITDATMRSLGLREGDIIRVTKAIEKRKPTDNIEKQNNRMQEQLRRDEELARQLQAQETGAPGQSRSPAPNLFAGPGGVLKNPRRGRPQPSKTLPPSNVDLKAISTASDHIQRTGSPQTMSPANGRPSSDVQPPARANSAAPVSTSGFDDDAWTNRPASTKPVSATPPLTSARTSSAPPLAAATPPPASLPAPTPTTTAPSQPQPSQTPSLAQTTESDIFNQLARLGELRKSSTPSNPPLSASPAFVSTTPVSYQSGLGMGGSPVPMGQHLQNQRTGILSQPSPQPQMQSFNAPRGPFAPVPANQGLLQPLIPTQTGFNSFVPTRPALPSFQPQMATSPFLSSQPTGMPPNPNPPMMSQPTGVHQYGSFNPTSPFQNPGNFVQVQSHATGFNPNMNQPMFGNGFSSPPPVPALPNSSSNNTNPANIFAQMKSGTFASDADGSVPQPSDKYDALRPNTLAPQATGWGQPYGYMGYQR